MRTRLHMIAIVLGCGIIALAGCEKKQQDEAKDKASNVLDQAKSKAGEVGEQARQAWESLKTEVQPQVDQMNSALADLNRDAAKFKDEQLDGTISQLDTKLRELKDKLASSMSSQNLDTLKQDFKSGLDEVKALYEKAKSRLAELSKTPG